MHSGLLKTSKWLYTKKIIMVPGIEMTFLKLWVTQNIYSICTSFFFFFYFEQHTYQKSISQNVTYHLNHLSALWLYESTSCVLLKKKHWVKDVKKNKDRFTLGKWWKLYMSWLKSNGWPFPEDAHTPIYNLLSIVTFKLQVGFPLSLFLCCCDLSCHCIPWVLYCF